MHGFELFVLIIGKVKRLLIGDKYLMIIYIPNDTIRYDITKIVIFWGP